MPDLPEISAMKMSNSSKCSFMELDQIQSIALNHAQCIGDHVENQVCLSQQIVEGISAGTALEWLHRPLPRFNHRGDIQVCEVLR